ncbi:OLC1v1038911C1 [Oldenlandia corymbosa var. corymbosa]|uniref:tRNA pseudouridine synthase n=1 Tax=Oldenlandia corymbosa var. corymbosa TaxID=529605 RepID=A0AAV1D1V2_OLDCO|nr:OLC1v1038911C1 [Oldenlandia corymbosa var. corymbosa]
MNGDRSSPPSSLCMSVSPNNSPPEKPEDLSSERPHKILKLNQEECHIDEEEEEKRDEEQEAIQETDIISTEPQMNRSNHGIQRYLIAIEYIGTRFAGAQQQSNQRTVVGVLQEAFRKFVGQPVSIFCSSRTDSGVHALSNVCHVDVERISKRKPGETLPPHEPAVVKKAVNHFLQKNEGDVMVIDVRCVPSDFHSRYKAKERTYFYRILSGSDPLTTFEKDRAWHVTEKLDLLSMQKACQVLVGRHDFSSFRAAGCQANSPIRTMDELNVTEVASPMHFPSVKEREQSIYNGESSGNCVKLGPEVPHASTLSYEESINSSNGELTPVFGMRKHHRCFVVTARACSFLYHQVRLLVGVLKAVGTGEITVNDVERILNAKSVAAAKPMAPACGLYLGQVRYDLPP